MEYKKLIPSFGCRDGQAVILDEGREYFSDDVVTLSRYYSDNGADALLIRDLSDSDEDHERTILMIKEAARAVDIPILAGGRIRRLEDIKKYLYAGAGAVFLDGSNEDNVDLIKEGASRFGSEKIYVWLPEIRYLERAEEFGQLGASGAILYDCCEGEKGWPGQGEDPVTSRDGICMVLSGHRHIPLLVYCDQDTPEAAASFLRIPTVQGVVLTVPEEYEGNCMNLKQELKMRGIAVDTFESEIGWEEFKLNPQGLIPVVVQDYKTSEVLMVAYMNQEAFDETLKTGKMTYYSRSRQSLWLKGETSGHFQYVKSLRLDCDNDTILAKVRQVGAACHTGARSCFFKTLTEREYKKTNPLDVFEEVFDVIKDRKEHPKEGSYTNYLFDKGLDKILKKLGEEATEIVIAAKNPNPEEIKYEIADFLYHMMVLMADRGISWEEIMEELAYR